LDKGDSQGWPLTRNCMIGSRQSAHELRQEVYGRLEHRSGERSSRRLKTWGLKSGTCWLGRSSARVWKIRQVRWMFPQPQRIPTARRGELGSADGSDSAWRDFMAKSPGDTTSLLAKAFFPQSQALGIAPDDTMSPRVLEKDGVRGDVRHEFSSG